MSRTSSIRSYVDAVTETWVGLSLPPVLRAIDDANWSPDSPWKYCHRCGESVGQGEATSTGCGVCRGTRPPWQTFVRLGRYEHDLREWILTIKYDRWYEMAAHLGTLLGRTISNRVGIGADTTVIVPMPMPWQRRIYRGIDHAHLIAAAAGKVISAPTWGVLSKSNGQPQANMKSKAARHENMRDRMRVKRGVQSGRLAGLHVVLVDDIRTSGATLKAAARLLRSCKPDKLTVAVLAVSDESSSAIRRATTSADA